MLMSEQHMFNTSIGILSIVEQHVCNSYRIAHFLFQKKFFISEIVERHMGPRCSVAHLLDCMSIFPHWSG